MTEAKQTVNSPALAAGGLPLLLAAIAGLLLLPGLILGPAHDGAIFSTIGEQWIRGSMPYRDAWDHKPPLIYVVTAAAAALPGATWVWVWLFTLISVVATGTLVGAMRGPVAAILATASLAVFPVALGGGQTENFAALGATAAVFTALRGRYTLAGALGAIALLFSVQAAPVGIALALLARGRVLYVIGGGLGVMTTAVLVVAASGLLGDVLEVLVIYSVRYIGSQAGIDELPALVLGLLPAVILAVSSTGRPYSRLELACLGWTVGALLLLVLQGRHLSHYVAPTVIPLSILAIRPDRPAPRPSVIVAAAALLLIAALAPIAQLNTHRGPPTSSIGAWIAANTQPTDRILDWGVEANIYLAADRAPAGRYPYLMPLVTPGYTTREMVESWVDKLASDPPAVIVDSEAANDYWPEGEDFLRPPPPGTAGGRNLDIVEPFRKFVRDRYVLQTEIDGRNVYVLR
jgi:hypothetical protein